MKILLEFHLNGEKTIFKLKLFYLFTFNKNSTRQVLTTILIK